MTHNFVINMRYKRAEKYFFKKKEGEMEEYVRRWQGREGTIKGRRIILTDNRGVKSSASSIKPLYVI